MTTPSLLYTTRDVARRAKTTVQRASSLLSRRNIGTLVGDRRQLTESELQEALDLLKNAKVGNPDFGEKWKGRKKTAKGKS